MVARDFLHHHHCHDGSSLIVDFPQAPRRQRGASISDDSVSSAPVEATQPMKKKRRSVSFSATSELTSIPSKSEQDLASAWYSKEDKDHQKRMILRNAAEVSRILKSRLVLTDEELCETIGMDNFLSPSHIRSSKIGKKRHAQSIVFAQDKLGPALLSQLSKKNSSTSRQRAYERASSQFRQFWIRTRSKSQPFPPCI